MENPKTPKPQNPKTPEFIWGILSLEIELKELMEV